MRPPLLIALLLPACSPAPALQSADADPDASLGDALPADAAFHPVILPSPTVCFVQEETCDGQDNDCDGIIDNIKQTPCSVGQGACLSNGVYHCEGDERVCSAQPGQPRLTDICNGLDDDCDGQTDEGHVETVTFCGMGVCRQSGRQLCVQGARVDTCRALEPKSRIDSSCDLLDDDCDGPADEDSIRGAPCTVGQGLCAVTALWECTEEGPRCPVAPLIPPTLQDSSCDLIDDDCDGLVDEDPPCNGTACSVAGEAQGRVPWNFVCMPSEENPRVIGATEVSQQEWMWMMEGSQPSYRQGGEHPVDSVSILDVLIFLNRKSRLDGLGECYRLDRCWGIDFFEGCLWNDVLPQHNCFESQGCNRVEFLPECSGWRLPTEDEWDELYTPEWVGPGPVVAVWDGEVNTYGLKHLDTNVSEWVWGSGSYCGGSAYEQADQVMVGDISWRSRQVGFRMVRRAR